MNINFNYELNGVNWFEVAELFRRAPLGVRDPDKLRRACEKSFVVYSNIPNETPVTTRYKIPCH